MVLNLSTGEQPPWGISASLQSTPETVNVVYDDDQVLEKLTDGMFRKLCLLYTSDAADE